MSATTESVGVRALRTQVAALLRRAEAGERVVVTLAGRPVAQLGPVAAEHGAPTLTDLVAGGLLIAPRRAGGLRPDTDVVAAWAGARLDRLLRDVRG